MPLSQLFTSAGMLCFLLFIGLMCIHLLFIYLHQGGDVTDSVCPFVCLSVCVIELLPFKHYRDVPELKQDYTKSLGVIFMKPCRIMEKPFKLLRLIQLKVALWQTFWISITIYCILLISVVI